MYEIIFFQNLKGESPVREYIGQLVREAAANKDSRVKATKIHEYMQALSVHGTHIGMPYVRHIEEDIWELRPTSDRIFFFCHKSDTFVMLHHFRKKTQTTPRREIEQAKRNRDMYQSMED